MKRYNPDLMRWVEELWEPVPVNPVRSTLTQVVNEIVQTRKAHTEAFQYDAGYDGGEFSGPAHARAEEHEVQVALASNGWTWDTLTDELLKRTSPRWAKFVVMGWV